MLEGRGVLYGTILSVTLAVLQPSMNISPHDKHLLSLPIFLFLIPDIKQGLNSLSELPSASLVSSSYLILASNLVSQLVCVSGVNRLSSVSYTI
jgi:UDP-xylose/UDP-N-acetylglucosamine transporter B4